MRTGAYDDAIALAGIPTFFRAPYIPLDPQRLKEEGITVGIIGVPYEGGDMYRPGSSYGPIALRSVGDQFSSYLYELDVDLFEAYNVADCGDAPVNPVNIQKTHRIIADSASLVRRAGALPVLVGGDHSITTGGVMSLSELTDGPIGLLILDAHLDTSESIGGEIDSAASFITRLTQLPNLSPKNIAFIGIRGAASPRNRWDTVRESGMTVVSMMEVEEIGIKAAVEKALAVVKDGTKAFYLSYDLDSIDAAFVPGTTAPEPGGLTSMQVLQACRLLGRARPDAFDLVELTQAYDPSGVAARLAHYMIMNTLCAAAKAAGE